MDRKRMFAALCIVVLALGAGILALGAAPGEAQDRQKPTARLGATSPDSENEDGQPDPKPQRRLHSQGSPISGGVKSMPVKSMPLKNHLKAQVMMQKVGAAMTRDSINVALLGTRKYMVNDCLGVKASAGEFNARLANPTFRFDGNTVVMELEVPHISMYALKVRIRPNPAGLLNPTKACKFSGRFDLGGAASRVRVVYRCNPRVDVGLGEVYVGEEDILVRIGGLNLKPLQNNLDAMAKNMIEDALTNFLEGYMPGTLVKAIEKYLKSEAAAA